MADGMQYSLAELIEPAPVAAESAPSGTAAVSGRSDLFATTRRHPAGARFRISISPSAAPKRRLPQVLIGISHRLQRSFNTERLHQIAA
jgi:hypothetical protein